jgi:hypothetical protein
MEFTGEDLFFRRARPTRTDPTPSRLLAVCGRRPLDALLVQSFLVG